MTVEIAFKPLTECTFAEAVHIWNRSFEGYVVNMTKTADSFTARLGLEGLSPELSLVAYVGDTPAGIVLNGVKTVGGKKVAWNGGTGVATAFRGQGIGKALMEAAMALYRREKVGIATLEVFATNETAVSLYKRVGYEIVDRLLFLEHRGRLAADSFPVTENGNYRAIEGSAQAVRTLPFYRYVVPWQTQSANIRDGQSLVVQTAAGEALGYALYKRVYDDEGQLTSILLYQCQLREDVAEPEIVINVMLRKVFTPFEKACKRTTFNFLAGNEAVVRQLEVAGFTLAATQWFMVKQMDA